MRVQLMRLVAVFLWTVTLVACGEHKESPNLTVGLSGKIRVRVVQLTKGSQDFDIDLRDQKPNTVAIQSSGITPPVQIDSCAGQTRLLSPNRKYFITCKSQSDSTNLSLVRVSDNNLIFEKNVSGQLKNVIWNKETDGAAFMVQTVRVSANPYYVLHLLSGHPKQFESYRVLLVNGESGQSSTISLPGDFVGSYAQFLSWN